jgi:hypothetical protein
MHETSTSHYLANNLRTALRVAGPKNKDGSPGPLHAVTLQQSTRIARSTLRGLKAAKEPAAFNADLRTLVRLAQALSIPLALLLMKPGDWQALARAVSDVPAFMATARSMLSTGSTLSTGLIEQLLSAHGVYPEQPPRGVPANQVELYQLDARNEARRKAINVLGALILPTSRNRHDQPLLAALAATIANHIDLPGASPADTATA